MLDSPAFWDLSATAIKVLMKFMGKRQLARSRKGSKSERWIVTNNGEIQFTYNEAVGLGISRSAFARALDELISHGFIDVAQSGVGQFKATTLYAISERWRAWGTDDFVEKSRPQKPRWKGHIGFQPGHPYYPPKAGSEEITSNVNGTGASNVGGTGQE